MYLYLRSAPRKEERRPSAGVKSHQGERTDLTVKGGSSGGCLQIPDGKRRSQMRNPADGLTDLLLDGLVRWSGRLPRDATTKRAGHLRALRPPGHSAQRLLARARPSDALLAPHTLTPPGGASETHGHRGRPRSHDAWASDILLAPLLRPRDSFAIESTPTDATETWLLRRDLGTPDMTPC
ncbi:hypothetical protein PGTUg99_009222 [Puccinia graminis f. sp. tritici]|uniref:Uncharacterized protein n=1 Tax=Puccinia graminis f. sp. tritici TaxID=56615 RepID=A0A5B0MH05_PUCGR|nr:hypothetical protein PGTUg99_009222 [Puccinia graminis f. sp. tritici]